MKRIFRALAFTVFALGMISPLVSAQEIELIDTSGAWRLPFDGTRIISNGLLEGLHTGKSAEAIDYYLPDHTRFEVFAPANGVITDVFDPAVVDTLGFGWLVRINHNGTTSLRTSKVIRSWFIKGKT